MWVFLPLLLDTTCSTLSHCSSTETRPPQQEIIEVYFISKNCSHCISQASIVMHERKQLFHRAWRHWGGLCYDLAMIKHSLDDFECTHEGFLCFPKIKDKFKVDFRNSFLHCFPIPPHGHTWNDDPRTTDVYVWFFHCSCQSGQMVNACLESGTFHGKSSMRGAINLHFGTQVAVNIPCQTPNQECVDWWKVHIRHTTPNRRRLWRSWKKSTAW